MDLGALSTRQTPPLAVPLRFFLTAPFFLALGGLLLLADPDALTGRWSGTFLALTHLWVLGVMLMVMLGALQQIIPVLVGVPLQRPLAVSRWSHALLTPGVLLLAAGFLFRLRWCFPAAAVLLAGGILRVVVPAWRAVRRSPSAHATALGIRLALAALLVTLSLGIWLALGQGGILPLARSWTDLHLTWGLGGWTLLLVSAVAWQVVPMFQITPRYPRPFMEAFAPLLGVALAGWTLAEGTTGPLRQAAAVLLSLLPCAFALVTLDLQRKRRRRLPDATLDFWRLAMASLLAAVALWWLEQGYGGLPEWLPGLLVAVGFAGSAIFGMLYKILPFLVWLHLTLAVQARGEVPRGIPNMKQVIPASRPRLLFRVHLVWLGLLLAAPWQPRWLGPAAGMVALVLAGLLARDLWHALMRYRSRLETGG